MAFVRSKKVNGYQYYQLVRNYREGGKHRQEVLYHLGKHDSIEAALEAEHLEEDRLRDEVEHWLQEAYAIKQALLGRFGKELGGEIPNREDAIATGKRIRKLRPDADYLGPTILQYHDAMAKADWYEGQVLLQLGRLGKLTELKWEYNFLSPDERIREWERLKWRWEFEDRWRHRRRGRS